MASNTLTNLSTKFIMTTDRNFIANVWIFQLNDGQSDYPRTPQDTPGHPRTLQDSIICIFNILYERVDDGLVPVCWCIN